MAQAQARRSKLQAEAGVGEQANCAEVDCDANMELSRSSILQTSRPLFLLLGGGRSNASTRCPTTRIAPPLG